MSNRKWKLITKAETMIEAEIIRGMLEAQEIEALISKAGYANAMGITGAPGASIDVLVPNDQFEAANQLMEDYYGGELTEAWEIFAQVESMIEADMIRGLLEAQEIEVFVSAQDHQQTSSAPIDILVPNDQLAAARQALEDYGGELMQAGGEE